MSVTLNDLSPAALKAAMEGGTAEWGAWGSASEHGLYVEPIIPPSRRHCRCGCRTRQSYRAMANGVCLASGCEMEIRRWAKSVAALRNRIVKDPTNDPR